MESWKSLLLIYNILCQQGLPLAFSSPSWRYPSLSTSSYASFSPSLTILEAFWLILSHINIVLAQERTETGHSTQKKSYERSLPWHSCKYSSGYCWPSLLQGHTADLYSNCPLGHAGPFLQLLPNDPQPVLLHGAILSQMQDLAIALVGLQEVHINLCLQTVELPLNSSPALQLSSAFKIQQKNVKAREPWWERSPVHQRPLKGNGRTRWSS